MLLDAFISGLTQVLSWPAFGFLLIGAAVGFVVGILPGLGGLSTLALMLPFVWTIKEPISAFSFLLGMHAITGTTGISLPYFLVFQVRGPLLPPSLMAIP